MLLVLPEFDLLQAGSLAEACELLSGGDATILAGGTDLLTKMKHRRTVPRRLVNIKKIPGLDQIRHDAQDGLRIGALTTMQALKESAAIASECPPLSEAAGLLGTTQIRNLATLGGNLANASPSAETAPVLLTLDASVTCVGRSGERLIPLENFFVSPGRTSMKRDEVLTGIRVPPMPFRWEGVYLKHSLRMMDVAMVNAAVAVHLDGDVFRHVRIALGAVSPTPFRATRAETLMTGKRLAGGAADEELLAEAGRIAVDECFPIDDFRAYAAYRKKIVEMLITRGLEQAIVRFTGDARRTA